MSDLPTSVLFACSENAIRSPMAEALARHLFGHHTWFESAGLRTSEVDGFAAAVLEEIGIDLDRHVGRTFEEIDVTSFDLIITLSPEAHHRALQLVGSVATEVEYWPTVDPSAVEGSRESRLDAYRQVREGLTTRLRQRFGGTGGPTI